MLPPELPIPLIATLALALYALAFIAGGIYYLEQRVARIRDQFPKHAPIARLTGGVALGIGLLAAVALAGHLITGAGQFRLGALVATGAGAVFWIHRCSVDTTPLSRIRDGAMVFVCVALVALTRWWLALTQGQPLP